MYVPIFTLVILFFGLGSVAVAYPCNDTVALSPKQVDEHYAIVHNNSFTDLDRTKAFDKLICSDSTTVRINAIKNALASFTKPAVRNQVMLSALMQKEQIDIKLLSDDSLSKDDSAFVQEHGGIYSKVVTGRSLRNSCLSFYKKECDISYGMMISGANVIFGFGRVSGEFELSDSNELMGFIRTHNGSNGNGIPAIIKLY